MYLVVILICFAALFWSSGILNRKIPDSKKIVVLISTLIGMFTSEILFTDFIRNEQIASIASVENLARKHGLEDRSSIQPVKPHKKGEYTLIARVGFSVYIQPCDSTYSSGLESSFDVIQLDDKLAALAGPSWEKLQTPPVEMKRLSDQYFDKLTQYINTADVKCKARVAQVDGLLKAANLPSSININYSIYERAEPNSEIGSATWYSDDKEDSRNVRLSIREAQFTVETVDYSKPEKEATVTKSFLLTDAKSMGEYIKEQIRLLTKPVVK